MIILRPAKAVGLSLGKPQKALQTQPEHSSSWVRKVGMWAKSVDFIICRFFKSTGVPGKEPQWIKRSYCISIKLATSQMRTTPLEGNCKKCFFSKGQNSSYVDLSLTDGCNIRNGADLFLSSNKQ